MRLIDADALKDKILFGAFGMYYDAYDVQEMPTIDPESLRPKGQWVWCENGGYHCPACYKRFGVVFDNNYCPNCGADMRGAGCE